MEPLQVSVIGLGVSVTLLGGVVAYLIRRVQRHVVRTREQFARLGTIAREMVVATQRLTERRGQVRVLSEESLADIPAETQPTDDDVLAHLFGRTDGDPVDQAVEPSPAPRTSFERILDDDEG